MMHAGGLRIFFPGVIAIACCVALIIQPCMCCFMIYKQLGWATGNHGKRERKRKRKRKLGKARQNCNLHCMHTKSCNYCLALV